jgi:glycosyltransferase involved in cell wall biosynthesis
LTTPTTAVFWPNAGPMPRTPPGQGLARAILELLQDPEACQQKGLAARQRVQKEFSWEAGGRRYEEIMQQALAAG